MFANVVGQRGGRFTVVDQHKGSPARTLLQMSRRDRRHPAGSYIRNWDYFAADLAGVSFFVR